MSAFTFNTTPRLVSEIGAAKRLGAIVGDLLGTKILFITDPGIRQHGLDTGAIAALESQGLDVVIFDEVEADPSLQTVQAAAALAKASGCTGIVALGGGSSLDVAKVVAWLAGSGNDIETAWGVGNAAGSRLPLVLIPTTAGTGSEVTPVSIITVSGAEKRGISSPILLPDIALLDAELTLSLPPKTTAATGIDAMVHAIEAFASKNANNNPMSRLYAEKALHLLGANIRTAVEDPGNAQAREHMLLGSCFAGMAFANSPVAAVHALAYPIGGHFHVPHGLSNALILPNVLRFNAADPASGAAEAYAKIAPFAFPQLAGIADTQTRCTAFIDALAQLSADLGLEPCLRDVGIGEDDLPMMAREAMKQTRLLVNNPREVTEADALRIYQEAW